MGSKAKVVRLEQRAQVEKKLKERLTTLAAEGIAPAGLPKDPTVKKLRAELRENQTRLAAIDAREAQREEMARLKAEKAAAPKEEKSKKKKAALEAEESSKRQEKKKKKKESKGQAAAPAA